MSGKKCRKYMRDTGVERDGGSSSSSSTMTVLA